MNKTTKQFEEQAEKYLRRIQRLATVHGSLNILQRRLCNIRLVALEGMTKSGVDVNDR